MTDRIVGIDLGTSNTVVAIVDELDKVRVLPDPDGNTVHPSVVSFHPNGGVVVGVKGKQRKVIDPQHTIYSAKRMIGHPFNSHPVTETARRVPFEIKEGPNEQAIVVTRAGEFAIPEISAIVLDHAKKLASKALEHEVQRAVVTVPASFTDNQRAATANAGALAGLTVVRVLNEPTAAALAYGSNKRLNEIIAVYDYGGGTFDITILQLADQVYTVLGTSGDAFLGGEDMDERIVERMVMQFLQQNRVDLRTDNFAMMRLRAVAEHTKIELSRRSRAVVKVEEIAYAANGVALDLTIEITRDDFVSSVKDLIDRTFVSCKEAMALANVGSDRIADVILVGGTTRIPYVRDQVSRFFGKAPRFDVNPDDAIATGAALQASSIEQMLNAPKKSTGRIRKEDPAITPAKAEAFFGDLFGDKAAKPTGPEVPSAPPSQPARARRPSKELDWEPPAGSAFSEDADAVDVFGPGTPPPIPTPVALTESEAIELAEEEIQEIRSAAPAEPPRLHAQPGHRRAHSLDDEIPVEVSSPEIRLDELPPPQPPARPTPRAQRPQRPSDIPIEVSQPDIQLDPDLPPVSNEILIPEVDLRDEPSRPTRRAPIELDWAPPPGVEPAPVKRKHRWNTEPSVEVDAEALGMIEEPSDVEDIPLGRAGPTRLSELPYDPPSVRPAASTPPYAPPEQHYIPPAPAQAPQQWPVIHEPAPVAPVVPLPGALAGGAPAPRVASIVDVTPRGLGIATVAGFCEELIRRNSQLPAAVRKSFGTSRDMQDTVRIVITQGESRKLANNVVLGDLVLSNLPARVRGETRIDVEFTLDPSGILQVAARDAATGAEQRARLDLKGGMRPEELDAAAKRLKRLASIRPGDDT